MEWIIEKTFVITVSVSISLIIWFTFAYIIKKIRGKKKKEEDLLEIHAKMTNSEKKSEYTFCHSCQKTIKRFIILGTNRDNICSECFTDIDLIKIK
jgi:hypothetical protein